MADKVEEGLKKCIRSRLEARKVRGGWGWGQKLGRGKDDLDIQRR